MAATSTRHRVLRGDGVVSYVDVTDDNASAYPAVGTSGDQTIAGVKTFTDAAVFSAAPTFSLGAAFTLMPTFPVNTPVAATGNAAGNAAAVTAGITKITGADNTKGIVIGAVAGSIYLLYNSDATHTLKAWPATGGSINGISPNTAITVTAACPVMIIVLDATGNAFSLPLLAS